jgi:hypothetical protein
MGTQAHGIINIDIQIGDVVVAHYDNFAARFIKAAQMLSETNQKFLFELVAIIPGPAIWKVDVEQYKCAVVCDNKAAFRIELADSDSIINVVWLLLAIGYDPGITLSTGGRPEAAATFRMKRIFIELIGMRLGLLQAKKIRIFSAQVREEALLATGPNPVYVPSYDFPVRHAWAYQPTLEVV